MSWLLTQVQADISESATEHPEYHSHSRNSLSKPSHLLYPTMSDRDQSPGAGGHPEEPPKTEHLNIKVTDNNNEVFFKIKRTTALSKLMNAFCERQGKNLNTVRFLFDGARVNPTDSPDSVSIRFHSFVLRHDCPIFHPSIILKTFLGHADPCSLDRIANLVSYHSLTWLMATLWRSIKSRLEAEEAQRKLRWLRSINIPSSWAASESSTCQGGGLQHIS